MFFKSIASELRKAKSIKSYYTVFLAFAAITALSSAFMPMTIAKLSTGKPSIPEDGLPGMPTPPTPVEAPGYAATLFMNMGMIAVVIISAIIVTNEYKNNEIVTTFLAVPRRLTVWASKFLVGYGLSMLLGVLMTALSIAILVVRGAGFNELIAEKGFTVLAMSVIGVFPLVIITQAVGWFTRSTAMTTTIMVIVAIGMDGLLGMIPKIGDKIYAGLFMNNLKAIWNGSPMTDYSLNHSWIVIACWVVLFVVGGCFVITKRDS